MPGRRGAARAPPQSRRALSATTSPRRSSATTGIRQSGQHQFDQGVADAGRARLVPCQRRRHHVAACACDQRRRRNQHETRERRQRGDGIEHPQAGEGDRRGHQDEAHAPEPLDPSAHRDAIVSRCHVTPDSYGFACAATMTGIGDRARPVAPSGESVPLDDGAVMGVVSSLSHAACRYSHAAFAGTRPPPTDVPGCRCKTRARYCIWRRADRAPCRMRGNDRRTAHRVELLQMAHAPCWRLDILA